MNPRMCTSLRTTSHNVKCLHADHLGLRGPSEASAAPEAPTSGLSISPRFAQPALAYDGVPSGFGPRMAYGERPAVLYKLDGRTQVKFWCVTELPAGHQECAFCTSKDASLKLLADMETSHKCKACHSILMLNRHATATRIKKLPRVGAGKRRCMRCHLADPENPEAAIKPVDQFPSSNPGSSDARGICNSCREDEALRQQECRDWEGARVCKPAHGCGRLLPGKAFTGSLQKCIDCMRSISVEELCRRTKLPADAKLQAALDAGEAPVECTAGRHRARKSCCGVAFSQETFQFNPRGRGGWNMSCNVCHEVRAEENSNLEEMHAAQVIMFLTCPQQLDTFHVWNDNVSIALIA